MKAFTIAFELQGSFILLNIIVPHFVLCNVLFALNNAMLFVWIFSTCVLSKTFINSSIKDLLQNMGDNFTADEVSSFWCSLKSPLT